MSLTSRLSRIPAFGFGVSGPLATPLVPDHACNGLIHQMLDGGGAIFDTGPSYGGGLGEIRLGRALARHPDAFVMTKAGLLSSGLRKRSRDFSPDGLRASVEGSLQRLGREGIDLLWLHGPARHEVTPEIIGLLSDLRAAGKVRHFGIAGRTDDLLSALDDPVFEAVMLPLNRAPGSSGPDWARRARAAGRAVFAIEVLGGVHSNGKMTRGQIWRAAKRIASRGAAPEISRTASPEEALNWAYDDGSADIVLMTTTSRAHLKANIDTLSHRRFKPD